ncbi:MAG: glycosyltransferase family 4 protein [Anaerolineaceae bacterium]|nr:glycosyltransferase family 4 protein [Anaerolineaceae bacterium]
MRVLYFTRDYTSHDHRFLSELSRTSHDIYSLRLERQGLQREDRSLPVGITQILWKGGKKPVPRTRFWQMKYALRSVLRQVKPDVIHAGSIQTAALISAMAGATPLVSMSWGYDMLMDADRTRRLRRDTHFTLARSSVFVCDCDAVKQKAISFGFSPERIVKFPWGTDLKHFSPNGREKARKRLGWKDDDFVFLSLRAWEPIYDVKTVVKAFIQAARQQPALRLELLGGGSQQNELHQLLLGSGLMDRVHFGGRAGFDSLPTYYRAADIYTSASLTDGSSVSLLESLACGTPALLSSIPGNLEWVEDEENGWFFPVGDVAACAKKMLAAYENKEQLLEMRERSREIAEERADWELNFPKLLTAYKMALESV